MNEQATLFESLPTQAAHRPTTVRPALRPAVVSDTFDLLKEVDALRCEASALLPEETRGEKGQFFTPAPVAALMASLLVCDSPSISLLDAGAGVGSLSAAAVAALCLRPAAQRPERLHVTAYELDPLLIPFLKRTLALCQQTCEAAGIVFTSTVHNRDFLEDSVRLLECSLLSPVPLIGNEPQRFNAVIQNPPYRKIHSASPERQNLRRIGIETTNLYTGFLYAALRLLAPGGELVAITPRSFCNGSYFRPFRQAFLGQAALSHLHLFETRHDAFKEDAVLQETLVFRAVKAGVRTADKMAQTVAVRPTTVTLTSSVTATEMLSRREVPYADVVNPADPEMFIHVAADPEAEGIGARMGAFQNTLSQLGIQVSTGRVVDFRATEYLRAEPDTDTAPLIWPLHLNAENGAEGGGYVAWPRPGAKKPNALVACPESASLLIPNGNYVLVKRFSAKEQRRRITAAVYEGNRIPAAELAGVGFENHLNYFHDNGKGLPLDIAKGLAVYLNSTLVDRYFRHYSGHTQVNATDLKNLRYPTREQLQWLGTKVSDIFPAQAEVDALLSELIPDVR